jgi:hypothetical protein
MDRVAVRPSHQASLRIQNQLLLLLYYLCTIKSKLGFGWLMTGQMEDEGRDWKVGKK